MNPLKTIAHHYFAAFSNKDAPALAALLAENVVLQDWDIKAEGKAAVVKANQAIFDAVSSIVVTPIILVEENSVIAAQLEILVNGQDTLRVVDLLEFDSGGKICRVTAYKG